MKTRNNEISRRLTPTAVYKLQCLASNLRAKAKRAKKKFDANACAESLASRFRLPVANVARLVRA